MNYKPDGTVTINGKVCVYWNVSVGKQNYSQRNNEFSFVKGERKVNWSNECNITSIVRSMDYNGFIFPKGKYKQDEDNLADSMLHSKLVDDEYKKRYPALYKEWEAGDKDCYSPIELHKLLEIGTNEWIGADVDAFKESASISSIVDELINKRHSVVVSTTFVSTGHIVSLVGVAYPKDLFDECEKNGTDICSNTPVAYCYDDSWGTWDPVTRKYDCTKLGNDMWISSEVFLREIKPVGSKTTKMAHIFANPVATV